MRGYTSQPTKKQNKAERRCADEPINSNRKSFPSIPFFEISTGPCAGDTIRKKEKKKERNEEERKKIRKNN